MPTHRKIALGCLATLACVVASFFGEFLSVPLAHAAATQGVQGNLGTIASTISYILGFFITFMQIALLTMLWLTQWLLSNNLFSNPGMMTRLQEIWVFSRDIMNLLFALTLIGVAFYTIIVANGEFVKGKIVHFILAIILVNFSWFFPRVIIDVANVLTATIYSIPQALNVQCQLRDPETGIRVPCKVITGVFIFVNDAQAAFLQGQNPPYKCYKPLYCYQLNDYNSAASSTLGHTMLNALAVNFAKLATLAQVPASPGGGAAFSERGAILVTLWTTISIVAVFLVQLSLLAPLTALFVALLVRMIILWITIAFMPFAFLGFAVNGKLGTNVFGLNDYVWKNFWTAAFIPALVAIPFAIGFIMLSAASTVGQPDTGFVMNIPIISGITTWWDLVWLIAAAAIIWQGTFTAFKANEFIGQATEKIHGVGSSVAKSIGQLPLIAPLPVPGGTLGGAIGKARQLQENINLRARGYNVERTGDRQARGLVSSQSQVQQASRSLNTDFTANSADATRIEQAINRLQTNPGDRAELQKIAEILRAKGTVTDESHALRELREVFNDPGFRHNRKNDLTTRVDQAIARAAQPPTPPQNPPQPNP